MISNPVFWAVLFAGAIAQLVKISIFIVKHHQEFHLADLFVTGGMPSSHSALVVALVVSLFMTEGISNLFILSAVLAAITLRDAMGVRRTAGEEGRIIHQMIRKLKLKVPEYHYALGHKPEEVLAGSVIGALAGFIVILI